MSQEICLLDYGGGHELSPDKLKACLSTAATAVRHLCAQLETALEQADQVAQTEVLQLLQLRKSGNVTAGLDVNTEGDPINANARQLDTTEENKDEMVDTCNFEPSKVDNATSEAEEIYRQQALDYSVGHLASSVREDHTTYEDHDGDKAVGSLFKSLLKAAYEQ